MSDKILMQPTTAELQSTLGKFIDYLQVQKYFQPGKKLSVKLLRNAYNLHFKYAFTSVSILTYFLAVNLFTPVEERSRLNLWG